MPTSTKKWKEENKRQGGGGSLGFTWLVAGYATSYDNNPQKITFIVATSAIRFLRRRKN